MTKEEYEDCVSKLNTGTELEQIQAGALLAILPSFRSKATANDTFKFVNDAIARKLKEFDSE